MQTNLKNKLAASPYLTRLFNQFDGDEHNFDCDKKACVEQLELQIDQLKQIEIDELRDIELIKKHLRSAKSYFALLWALADLDQDTNNPSIPFSELGRLQSLFADACIEVALKAAWYSKEFNKLIDTRKVEGIAPGLFILGLGKLGGLDLNFSSDVDLVAFYDKQHFPKPRLHAATYVATRLLNLTTNILNDTSGGFVWRVDWRLRPYASTRDLTMITDAAVEFYQYQSRPWHRLAMMKARVVAGDQAAGSVFLQRLSSYLWRRDLDFRSIDEIAELKDKINQEHPELRTQRLLKEDPLDQTADFNIKLGYGGIREIEFLVNALQLVWAGRKPQLRISNTLSALEILVEEQIVQADVGNQLKNAYEFFRRAENRLQMRDNDQIYRIPTEPVAQQAYLALLGYPDWKTFTTLCIAHRQVVYQEFSGLFSESKTQHTPTSNPKPACDYDDLDDTAHTIVQQWRDGFREYGALPTQVMELRPLANTLCRVINLCGVTHSDAIKQIDLFLTRLPPGGQYLKLLHTNPTLADKWIRPLLISESMAVLINQTPHLIDRFLEQGQTSPQSEDDKQALRLLQLESNIVFYSHDYETRLENLRRLTNEELYFQYLAYLDNQHTPRQFEQKLTLLAEELLTLCVRVACEEMQLDICPIAIIGFGKLGMQAMMPQSDLDLVYVFADQETRHIANQFASRLQTVINAKMKQGRVYELDTRLRPSGRSGSVTISLDSFEQHQFDKAKTWSHLALFPARFVAGNKQVGHDFMQIRKTVLSRPRAHEPFLLDTMSMLNRIRRQRIGSHHHGLFAIKLASGGLMELEYLISCLALQHAPKQPELLDLSYDDAVKELSTLCACPLFETLMLLRSYQLEIRLFGQEDTPLQALPVVVQQHILTTLDANSLFDLSEVLEQKTQTVQDAIQQFYQKLDQQRLKDWQEVNIEWQ